MLTSVLWRELPHGGGQTFVELMLTGDQRLADGLVPEAQHAGVTPHLVHEGLKHHPSLRVALRLNLLLLLFLLLCIHGLPGLSLHSPTHPPLARTTVARALAF